MTDICTTVNEGCQKQLLSCIHALVMKTGLNHIEISCSLFKILLNVVALACNDGIRQQVKLLVLLTTWFIDLFCSTR